MRGWLAELRQARAYAAGHRWVDRRRGRPSGDVAHAPTEVLPLVGADGRLVEPVYAGRESSP